MWGMTQQEQRIALFLLATLGLGCGVLWYRQHQAAPPVDQRLVEEFIRRSAQAAAESTAAPVGRTPAKPRRPAAGGPLDLNAAGVEELMSLPGVGPVTAQRIVEHRRQHGRFRTPEDLLQVRGIGKRTFQKLQPLIVAK